METPYTIPRAAPFSGIDEWWITEKGAEWFTRIKGEDPVFLGHYPSNPILPGIYTFEACCQGIELYFARHGQQARARTVRSMRFLAAFTPGCVMRVSAEISAPVEGGITTVKFTVYRDNEKAATSKIQFCVEPHSC